MRRAGQQLGRYSLVRLLGRGGRGEVWEAVLQGPRGFARPVALKLLREDALAPEDLASLVREARIGALCQHPNVVGTYDLGEADGAVFLAMELVRGGTLRDLVRGRHLPPAVVLDVGMQACAGLEHIHSLRVDGKPAGLVHRDVKPANLLVDRSGLLKLADFGIALAADGGARAGTPGYASPEQLEGVQDARSDLFSLGATLYAVAVRQAPFDGVERPVTATRAAARLAVPGFFERVDERVAGLGDVLRRCLAPAPRDRWPSAAALRQALGELVARQPAGPALHEVVQQLVPSDAIEEDRSTSGLTDSISAETTLVLHGNLPSTPDAFFGRAGLVAEVGAAFDGVYRPITLLGPGGMGKTRLAIEVARGAARSVPGGVWFVDLSEARTLDAVCWAAAKALGLDLDEADPVERIGHAMGSRGHAVFVLDNLEQVIGPAATAVRRWLPLAPEAVFLCTSRIPLRIRGERRIPVVPLVEDEAAALFVDRAARRPAPDELDLVRDVVRQLDGMPLAIELCAARTSVLGLRELSERLSDRLRVLRGADRDRPDRHKSIEASLAWSEELLPPWGRRALAQLSVFEGGFTVEAAEAVLDSSARPQGAFVVAALEELCDASLVRFDADTGRFGLLAIVQAWAAAGLDDAPAARARHGAHFAQLGAPDALAALHGPGGTERVRRLVEERENLAAACRDAVARGDGPTAVATLRALAVILLRRGPFDVLVRHTAEVARLPLGEAERVEVLVLSIRAGRTFGDAPPPKVLEDALAEVRALGRVDLELDVLSALSNLHQAHGDDVTAEAVARRMQDLAERAGDATARGAALRARGGAYFNLSRYAEAHRCLAEALAIHRRAGHRRGEALAIGTLANVLHQEGDFAAASALLQQAVGILRDLGDYLEAYRLGDLGLLAKDLGRFAEAEAFYEEALRRHRAAGDRAAEAWMLGCLGYLHLELGDPVRAAPPLREAVVVATEVGDPTNAAQWLAGLARHAAIRGDRTVALRLVGEAERAFGERRHERQVWILCARAEVEHRLGDRDAARATLERARAWAAEQGSRADSRVHREIDRAGRILAL